MGEEIKEEDVPQEPSPTPPETPPSKYSKSTRVKAWLGIAFMVLLTLGYFYAFYSGGIINW
jgi:hypothetical protein